MKRKILFSYFALILLLLHASVFASVTAVDRAYRHVLSRATMGSWILVGENLPSEISQLNELLENPPFISGLRLKGTNTLIVFLFDKPSLGKNNMFCRSRVSVIGFINNSRENKHDALIETTSISNYAELVSFKPEDVDRGCRVSSIDGLYDYIYINSPLSDSDLIGIMDTYRALSSNDNAFDHCKFNGGIILNEIGISPYGKYGTQNTFYLLAVDDNKNISIILEREKGELYARDCTQGWMN